MKRIIGFILVLITLLLVSCGQGKQNSGAIQGIPYNFYEDIVLNNKDYKVYLPENVNQAMQYSLKESNETCTYDLWKVNTIVDLSYHAPSSFTKEDADALYEVLIEDEVLTKLSFTPTLSKSEEVILEGDIVNGLHEVLHYGVFIGYLQFMVYSGETGYFHVSVPVYSKIIGMTSEQSYDPLAEEWMDINDFIYKYKI